MLIYRSLTKEENQNKKNGIRYSFLPGIILNLTEKIECFTSNDGFCFVSAGEVKGTIVIIYKLETKPSQYFSLVKVLYKEDILYVSLCDYTNYQQL